MLRLPIKTQDVAPDIRRNILRLYKKYKAASQGPLFLCLSFKSHYLDFIILAG